MNIVQAMIETASRHLFCGMFQMCCDLFLGGQYWVYGEGEPVLKGHHDIGMRMNGHALNEKEIRLG